MPDDKIIWRSKGAKGYVDGAVTFHELAPNLTRILVVLEYHPQGMFERTGNIWRAQGRRARLELKHFRRHLMTEVLLNPDDIEGWRGTIHDGEVVESHEDAIAREEKERSQQAGARQSGDGQADETAEGTDETAESGAEEGSEAAAAEGEEPEEPDEERDERQERGERDEEPAAAARRTARKTRAGARSPAMAGPGPHPRGPGRMRHGATVPPGRGRRIRKVPEAQATDGGARTGAARRGGST